MSKRKRRYVPKAFESTGISGDTSANVYMSMLLSSAFKDLTARQKSLYLYIKSQYYGQKKKPEGYGDQAIFFNRAKWIKGKEYSFELYSRGADFTNDMKALESHGFIKTLERNWTTRERNVYAFSADWQTWKPQPS